jgi:membrane protein
MTESVWTLGGLSLGELLRRTARTSWQDAVFGQGGRMAFYHFLAIFPSLLLLCAVSAHVPPLSDYLKNGLLELSGQILPDQVSQLFEEAMKGSALSGWQLLSVGGGACWAAMNGTWAMIFGLNRAYEVEEHRSPWKLALTIAGLTFSLALAGFFAVFLIFWGMRIQGQVEGMAVVLRCLEWIVLIALLSCSFALLYRFAPNLRDHEWRWSTPGAVCALVLWIGSTLSARLYFEHVNDYARSYGRLNGVVMLLLWLYVTNGSILIGGEMNSEIEKAAVARREGRYSGIRQMDRSGS